MNPHESAAMPVFAIKAKDNLATHAICAYYAACICNGLTEQAEQVVAALTEIMDWREANKDKCKWPDHSHVAAGFPGSGSESTTPPAPQPAPVAKELPDAPGDWWRDGMFWLVFKRQPVGDLEASCVPDGYRQTLSVHSDRFPRGNWLPAHPRHDGEREELERLRSEVDGYAAGFDTQHEEIMRLNNALTTALAAQQTAEREKDETTVVPVVDLVTARTADRLRKALAECQEKATATASLLERAWGIIANAGGGDWGVESRDWLSAASTWRDDYHAIKADTDSAAKEW